MEGRRKLFVWKGWDEENEMEVKRKMKNHWRDSISENMLGQIIWTVSLKITNYVILKINKSWNLFKSSLESKTTTYHNLSEDRNPER